MKYILIAILSSCAAIPGGPPEGNNCGVIAAGDYDSRGGYVEGLQEIITAQLNNALDASTTVSAPGLEDIMDNCRSLVGYKVFTKSVFSWPDPEGRDFKVAGITYCWAKTIVVGTPATGNWNKSALVHEFFHAMQNCKADFPPDIGTDESHAGWYRYGIFEAIERVTK